MSTALPNPSFHLTCASRLRRLVPAGELSYMPKEEAYRFSIPLNAVQTLP